MRQGSLVQGFGRRLVAMASDRALNIAESSVSHRDDHLGWGASISVINESVEYIQDKSIKWSDRGRRAAWRVDVMG